MDNPIPDVAIAVSNLHDHLVAEILSRCPIRSLEAFRVFPEWRILIESDYFLKKQLECGEKTYLIHAEVGSFNLSRFRIGMTTDIMPPDVYGMSKRVVGIYRGMVLLTNLWGEFIIWNPALSLFKSVPINQQFHDRIFDGDRSASVGLAYHQTPQVVIILPIENERSRIFIYSDLLNNWLTLPDTIGFGVFNPLNEDTAPVIGGNPYWIASSSGSDYVLWFDPQLMMCRSILSKNLKLVSDTRDGQIVNLVNWKGNLACIRVDGSIEVRVFNEGLWTLIQNISLEGSMLFIQCAWGNLVGAYSGREVFVKRDEAEVIELYDEEMESIKIWEFIQTITRVDEMQIVEDVEEDEMLAVADLVWGDEMLAVADLVWGDEMLAVADFDLEDF